MYTQTIQYCDLCRQLYSLCMPRILCRYVVGSGLQIHRRFIDLHTPRTTYIDHNTVSIHRLQYIFAILVSVLCAHRPQYDQFYVHIDLVRYLYVDFICTTVYCGQHTQTTVYGGPHRPQYTLTSNILPCIMVNIHRPQHTQTSYIPPSWWSTYIDHNTIQIHRLQYISAIYGVSSMCTQTSYIPPSLWSTYKDHSTIQIHRLHAYYGVATISRLLKIMELFCKRAL